jgi:hypothetical protein
MQLKRRIKNRKGQVIGVLISDVRRNDPTIVGVGWSLCKKGDRFNPAIGGRIAQARVDKPKPVPHSIKSDYIQFVARSQRYFKGQTVLATPVKDGNFFLRKLIQLSKEV